MTAALLAMTGTAAAGAQAEVREAGEPANSPPGIAATVELAAGKAYTVAVGGIGEKLELLDISDAAAAVSAAGGVATGFIVQQRRSSG
jgi:hypothetical protein